MERMWWEQPSVGTWLRSPCSMLSETSSSLPTSPAEVCAEVRSAEWWGKPSVGTWYKPGLFVPSPCRSEGLPCIGKAADETKPMPGSEGLPCIGKAADETVCSPMPVDPPSTPSWAMPIKPSTFELLEARVCRADTCSTAASLGVCRADSGAYSTADAQVDPSGTPDLPEVSVQQKRAPTSRAPTSPNTSIETAHLSDLRLSEINPEVQASVLLWLHGYEAALVATASRTFADVLSDKDDVLWAAFFAQEATQTSVKISKSLSPHTAYVAFVDQMRCRGLQWHSIPCSHQLGAREGSPGMFSWRGFVFVYGGWGNRGPSNDLHVGRLDHPLQLRRLRIEGNPLPPSYEMKVTPLIQDDVEAEAMDTLKVAVTGGYRMGGYHRESNAYGLLQISLSSSAEPDTITAVTTEDMLASQTPALLPQLKATWLRLGTMTPRACHSATFVPPSVAGSEYPKGYLLLFGGTVQGRCVNTTDVLDMNSMEWETEKATFGELPQPRNLHSATLLPTAEGTRLLIMGGGTGAASNGGPPRGGRDLSSAFWLDPRSFAWERAPEAESELLGRGHMVFKLSGTAVVLSGGRWPAFEVMAFGGGRQWPVEVTPGTSDGTSDLPDPRILGASCLLPDGTLLLYGGWHPGAYTYADFWAAHLDVSISSFCEPLMEPEVPDEEVQPLQPGAATPLMEQPVRARPRVRRPAGAEKSCCTRACKAAQSAAAKVHKAAWEAGDCLARAVYRCFPPNGYSEAPAE
eukprot:TRINITY_DN8029_c0_g1_i1.p1 TRINITY_DN8029_c0_g1~~TRINITY_DN8029_c0_g1_i1.p1  ORF type:complete len:758 (-),score=100.65 TRINITY_DN8029_c0_g1_i1:138-2372(-)